MASRVNTKFLVIIALVLGVIGAAAGAFWYLHNQGDSERYFVQGQESFAAGDYEAAQNSFGRALKRDEGNRTYLARYEEAILARTPITLDQARELHDVYLGALRHEASHFALQGQSHLRYMRELQLRAQVWGSAQAWVQLQEAAETALSVAADDDRVLGRKYRGIAIMQQRRALSVEELRQAEEDLLAYVEARPQDDEGWAALIEAQIHIGVKMASLGQTSAIAGQYERVQESTERAMAAVPDGVLTAAINLGWLSHQNDPATGRPPVSDEAISAALDRLVELAPTAGNPSTSLAVASRLTFYTRFNGLATAAGVLEDSIVRFPDDVRSRFRVANLRYRTGDLDLASEQVDWILNAEQKTVGLMSVLQFPMRTQAAALKCDIRFRRFEQAEPEQRDAILAQLQADRDALAAVVKDPEVDTLLIKTDAKLALARNEIAEAAERFERYLELAPGPDFEVLVYSAACLRDLGNPGLALERLNEGVRLRPNNVVALSRKADLQLSMGLEEDARASIDAIRELDPDAPTLESLIPRLDVLRTASGETEDVNPLARALVQAEQARQRGDFDAARDLLREVRATAGEETWRIEDAMARLEFSAGEPEAALAHARVARDLQPENRRIQRFTSALEQDNPVDRVLTYVVDAYEDPMERDLALLFQLGPAAVGLALQADQLEENGEAAEAAEKRALAERAQREVDESLARVSAADPTSRRLFEYRFMMSMIQRDWSTMEAMLPEARTQNHDLAGGLTYRGRYHLLREEFEEAVQALTQATERVGYSAVTWKSLGLAQLRLGDVRAALTAYERSYEVNPADLEVVGQYTALLVRTGQTSRALGVMRAARQLGQSRPAFRNRWLALESTAGDQVFALVERRRIYAETPDDIDNALALATLLGEVEPTQETILDEDGEPVHPGNRWRQLDPSEQAAEIAREREAWFAEADRILVDVAEQNEDIEPLRLAAIQANLLRARGQVSAGERHLSDFVASVPEAERTATMYLQLGNFQLSVNRLDAAIESFEAARPLQSESLEADQALGSLYLQLRRLELALEHLTAVHDATGDRGAATRIVDCLINLDRFDEAQAMLEEQVAQQGGRSFGAWMQTAFIAHGRASALIADGDEIEADLRLLERDEALKRARESAPSLSRPYIVEADFLIDDFRRSRDRAQLDEALVALDNAARIDAADRSISAMRVDVFRALGETNRAIGELNRVLDTNPRNVGTRRQLIMLHLGLGNDDTAINLAQEGIEVNPNIPVWYDLLGTIMYTRKRDFDAATEMYAEAYGIDPGPDYLMRLANAELLRESPRYEELVGLIATELEVQPDNPLLGALNAQALRGAGRRDAGLAELRRVYPIMYGAKPDDRAAPFEADEWYDALGQFFGLDAMDDAEAFVTELAGGTLPIGDLAGLGRLWIRGGATRAPQAISFQRRAAEACPERLDQDLADLYQTLATYHLIAEEFSEAQRIFGQILGLQPDNTEVLNNYAYLTAEYLKDPAAALPSAERAVDLQPDNHQFLDTLGWIYYYLGEYAKASQQLTRSVDIQPTAEAYVHLAYTEFKMSDYRRASQSLARAAEFRPDARTQSMIDRLAADIQSRTGG